MVNDQVEAPFKVLSNKTVVKKESLSAKGRMQALETDMSYLIKLSDSALEVIQASMKQKNPLLKKNQSELRDMKRKLDLRRKDK